MAHNARPSRGAGNGPELAHLDGPALWKALRAPHSPEARFSVPWRSPTAPRRWDKLVTVTGSARRARCEWCEAEFAAAQRGPLPRYCRPSHRQRAYEARVTASSSQGAHPIALDALLDDLERALARPGDGHALVDAAEALLLATGRAATVPRSPVKRGRSSTARAKPWKVVLHAAGTDPVSGELFTAHTTERAAQTARRQLETLWREHQFRPERQCWTWAAVADAEGVIVAEPRDRKDARAAASALFVRPEPDVSVRYRRYPDARRPDIVRMERVVGTHAEPLAGRHHFGPAVYYADEGRGTLRAGHPYVLDLLRDVCDFVHRPTKDWPRLDLHAHVDDFIAEVLATLGDSWELEAELLRAWLEARGVIRVIYPAIV